MVNAFKNFKVGTRILIGYVIALLLMAVVIIIAIVRIQEINDTVTTLAEGLATEQHLADRVVENVWATHFYALQYMDQQNSIDLERYQAEYDNFTSLLQIADQRITTQERLTHLENIRSGIQTYGEDFSRVIGLITTRNRELLVNLDQQGRLAEIKLEQIRANSFFADDPVTSYQAGNAQRALLLMRVAAFQFLESGDAYWIDEFNRAYESAQVSFQKLDEATQSRIYRELANDAEAAVGTYVRSFAEVQDNYSQQEEIVTSRLNVLGPIIRGEGAAIAADVAIDFQAAASTTQALAAQTQSLLLLTMGVAILTALGSGVIISRSITIPLEKVTEVARQIADLDLRKLTSEMGAIAQGDLTRDLTITTQALSIHSGDEIGQMARAFDAIIQQLQKTGAAFSEMTTNLRTLTEHNTRLFELAQAARLNAEAASQAKSNFLANMSHELRTPLNAILGYAQILRLERNLPASHLSGLTVIKESGRHLLTLINDILDLAKIEAGKVTLQPTAVHFPTLIESVARMMQLRAWEKGIVFEYQLGANLPSGVEVDEKRLRQVLINLLSNAIKFTPGGTVTLQAYALETPEPAALNSRFHAAKSPIRIAISDTGIGIQPDQVSRIFEPFEQLTTDSLTVEGTGLGLPISQRLVQAMGSSIQVESALGKGSVFWFDLLLPVIETESPAKPLSLHRPVGYSGVRQIILIIDDEYNTLSLLADFLRLLGFETLTAKNNQKSITQALQLRPNLIFIAFDPTLTASNNAPLVTEIRQLGGSSEINIIGILPGQGLYGTADYGCDGYLTTPIDFDTLTDLLGQCLRLTWLFREGPALATQGTPVSGQVPQLIAPSQDDLNDLYDLAMKGNMPGIAKRAAEIAHQNNESQLFAQLLQKFAKAYDEESVLSLLQQNLNRES
jgi:signal transduction histidine kinase